MTAYDAGVARAIEARNVAKAGLLDTAAQLEAAEAPTVNQQRDLNFARWVLDRIADAEDREAA